jgi:cysteinyl-tRNA synthetase
VLWKAAKPGEPQWPSPWGGGRPGWHIECSAMSTHCLGAHFDIHGGGMDLMFPHHENEIAQSEAATGHKFVNLWMHNGFVQIDEEKMSKSLGNFFTVREILARYKAEVVRYFILASHYRSPLNYSDRNLDTARAGLDRYYQALRGLTPAAAASGGDYQARFEAAMDDDFNTPEAWAVLSDLRNHVNLAKDKGEFDEANRLAGVLVRLGGVLGMLQQDPEDWFKTGVVARPESLGSHSSALNSSVATADGKPTLDDTAIQSLIDQRATARRNKDFATSDLIREELDAQGILLEDGPQGTTWRRKS